MHEKPLTLAAVRQGFLERLDPRVKILCAVAWAVCVVTLPPDKPVFPGIFAAILLLLLLGNVRLIGKFARRFGGAMPFILLLTVLLPFFKAGEAVWSLGPFEATREGLQEAQRVAMAAILCVAAVSIVWASTTEAGLLFGLRGVGLPAIFVGVIAFMLRYLHVLRPELHRLTDARAERTIGTGGPGRLRAVSNVVGTLFLRAHDRAERVSDAMAARCFTGEWRTWSTQHMHAPEIVVAVVFAAAIVGLRVAAGWRG